MIRKAVRLLFALALLHVSTNPLEAGSVSGRNKTPELAHAGDLSGVLIDLNSHSSTVIVSADTLRRAQIELVVHRLTIGRFTKQSDADRLYSARFDQVRFANAKFGAYHVLFPSPDGRDNGEQQAKGFLTAVHDFCPVDERLLLAVDWERVTCYKNGRRRDCGIPAPAYLMSFISYFKNTTGKYPIVYTSREALAKYLNDIEANAELKAALRKSPLWFSQPRRRFRPSTDLGYQLGYFFPLSDDIRPWSDWTFWQFGTDEGGKDLRPTQAISMTVGGEPADFSWYNGSRQEFHHFFEINAVSCRSLRPQ